MERGVGISGKTGKVAIRKNKARKKVSSDDFDLSDEELLAQQQLQQQPNSQQQQQQLQQVYSQQQSQQQQQQQSQPPPPPQQQIPVTGPGGGKKKGGKKRKEKIMSGGPRGGINVSKKGKQHGMMSSSQVGLMNEVQKDTGYYSAGQNKINDMMRRALEDEQYSALGSIVDTDSSDDESTFPMGSRYGIDRNAIMEGFRQNLRLERENELGSLILPSIRENNFQRTLRSDETGSSLSSLTGSNKGKGQSVEPYGPKQDEGDIPDDDGVEEQEDEEESSMFGQSSGSNNATWVECDKCKKWRRLRGSVDAKKLPPKWFCSMNKNDPEHAKCSAPEEEYNENNTPESATDHRIRKHLRLWVRRLQSNEAYEQKLPTMTRGKKKSVTTNSKEPYEWVRCANPSCGKFRAILRFMDASTICDNARNGEWYCVLNTWDEKMASCAAPQENLPASGCPPWVLQDE